MLGSRDSFARVEMVSQINGLPVIAEALNQFRDCGFLKAWRWKSPMARLELSQETCLPSSADLETWRSRTSLRPRLIMCTWSGPSASLICRA